METSGSRGRGAMDFVNLMKGVGWGCGASSFILWFLPPFNTSLMPRDMINVLNNLPVVISFYAAFCR